ncbi:MAG: twin-arginine translocase subunit TatC [Alphaproteobacteria bacterium]
MSDDINDRKMPLLEHIIELRNRLIYAIVAFFVAFAVCYYFADHIFAFLLKPLADAMQNETNPHVIYTNLTELFVTYIKVAAFAALFVSFPIVAAQIWMFVAPGLYKNERGAFLPYLFATPVLFFLGGSLVYYVVMPLAWKFFLSFQTPAGPGGVAIHLEAKANEYLSLVMTFIFAFGLCFQLPILLTLLARVGLVSSAMLASKRRYAIVIIFIAAAFLTPPDVLSMISLALPLLLLYEISLLAVRLVEKRAQQAQRQAAPGTE